MSRRPGGMTESAWHRISKLPPHLRDRVLERSAILHFEAGVPYPDADEQALALECDQVFGRKRGHS